MLREALGWLIPEAASQSVNLEANRQFLEGLRSDDQPEVRQAAQKILGRLPRPAPSQSKLIQQAMANMQVSNPAIQVLGHSSVRLVAEATPELVAVIRNLARSEQEPEVRLAANQALRRLHILDETDGVETVEFYREIAEGRAKVPDLLAALSGSQEAVLPSITALSAMGGQYWKTHPEHRESASRTLRTLLQDPDPVRVEAAASALKRIQPELPKSIYTLRELEPLFLAMQDWLTPGEYAIAMRDFQSSAESMWQVFGYGDTPPTHVWRNLVEVLPVGPMHENRPANGLVHFSGRFGKSFRLPVFEIPPVPGRMQVPHTKFPSGLRLFVPSSPRPLRHHVQHRLIPFHLPRRSLTANLGGLVLCCHLLRPFTR